MSESDPDSQVNQAISQISSTIAELELTPAIRTPQPTSSIDQVPTELLSLIFDFACSNNLLQEYPWISHYKAPTKLSSPVITYLPALVISAVCTRWRCIALALPGLWARLRLEISEKPVTSDVFMAILQLYLDHSAHAPLFLDLFIGLTDNGKDDHNPPALDLLLEHTRRWKSLQYITDRKISKTMLSLPILEVLAIECPWGDAVAEDGLDCFQVAPKLHTLTMREEYNPGRYIGYEDLFLSQLHRHQLTSLNAALAYDELAILQDLSNLTTLELCVYHYYERNQPQTLLCRLKSFTLIVDLFYWPRDSESLHHILIMFTLPSLNELIICD
ncbi:hypothetical protein BT96DRAFT_209673 [Gymnopus androsaceus JB14]|uniref:F-box domain-containing protein n=1 Tax=Gymnopus androsaceus JB14 TaxID=1447944 RepID=A0A6A4H9M6_9AGAR|nr:hypothetical protein BT96DRAFT_209673 [Gymnopus androsaceus JB14]